jgi:hypothetical protein
MRDLENKDSKNIDDFVISQLVERILNLKKRLDRLVFMFIVVIVFGFLYTSDFKNKEVLGVFTVKDDMIYHVGLTLLLSILFAIIGSHLIEYVRKRSKINERLINNKSFFTSNSNEKTSLDIISETLIPVSFYEYLFRLDSNYYKKDSLRFLSVFVLFVTFFSSHTISIVHLFLSIKNLYIVFPLIFLIVVILFLLYKEFVNSITNANNLLGKKIKRVILYSSIFFCLIFLPLILIAMILR